MELTQLEYFIKLAEYENFTTASKELHITQPALSIAINKMESELGAKLFDRRKGKIFLNKYGQILLPHAVKIFDELTAAINEISDSSEQINISYIFLFPMKQLIIDYLSTNPNTIIYQHNFASFSELEKALLSSEIAFAIAYHPPREINKELHFEKLCDDRQYVVVSVNNPLARKDSVKYIDLKDARFVKNVFYNETNDIHIARCMDAGFSPNFVFEGSRSEILDNLICQNYGIAFIGEGGVWLRKSIYKNWEEMYRFLPLDDETANREIGIISKDPASLSPGARDLYKYIRTNYLSLRNSPQPSP